MTRKEFAVKCSRGIFKKRGDHSEVHLGETELAEYLIAVLELWDTTRLRTMNSEALRLGVDFKKEVGI
jgi:hypothetical protein